MLRLGAVCRPAIAGPRTGAKHARFSFGACFAPVLRSLQGAARESILQHTVIPTCFRMASCMLIGGTAAVPWGHHECPCLPCLHRGPPCHAAGNSRRIALRAHDRRCSGGTDRPPRAGWRSRAAHRRSVAPWGFPVGVRGHPSLLAERRGDGRDCRPAVAFGQRGGRAVRPCPGQAGRTCHARMPSAFGQGRRTAARRPMQHNRRGLP